MAKTADVQQAIWSDPWFHGLPPDAKLLYLWAITTDHGNLAGLFTVAVAMIQFETGLSSSRFDKAVAALDGKVIFRRESGVIWVVGRAKHVRSKTSQIATSIARAVKECPDEAVKAAFVEKYANHRWLAPVLTPDELALVTSTSRGIPATTRAAVFARDEHKCVDCGAVDNLTIDHIRPESHGGSNGEDNLAVRCLPCNVRKGSALPSQMIEPLQEVPSPSQSQSLVVKEESKGTKVGKGSAPDPNVLPVDFDPRLALAAQRCLPVLVRTAEAKGAKPVALLAVARAVESFPHRDHFAVAGDVEHWLVHGNGSRQKPKDVVARFRNFLESSGDVATPTSIATRPGESANDRRARIRAAQGLT